MRPCLSIIKEKRSLVLVWPGLHCRVPGGFPDLIGLFGQGADHRGEVGKIAGEGGFKGDETGHGLGVARYDRCEQGIHVGEGIEPGHDPGIQGRFPFNPGGAGFYCDSYAAFYTDWRLPNMKELQSLLDRSTYSPALPPDHPFKYRVEQYIGSELKQVRYFWTSTTITTDFNIAYTVDILKGHPNIGAKSKAVTEYAHVLPVRTTKTTGADANANNNKVLVDPASHNFKKVTKGQTPPLKYFTVTNNSDEKIKVDDVKILPGAGTNGTVYSNPASDCGSKALQPSETCTISVAFTPDSEGEKNATLQISTTGVDSSAGPVLNPKLTGEGVADQMYTVNVYRTGPGAANGSIASYDGGIACGEDCSETYPQGTMIQLYGTYFPENWSGPCKPKGTHCVIDSLEKSEVRQAEGG